MKRSYEFKLEEFQTLNRNLNLASFIQDIKEDTPAIEYALRYVHEFDKLPTIYVVTTVENSLITVHADINRLSNTLRLVPKLTWIIVEDSLVKTQKLANFLKNLDMTGIVHLNAASPESPNKQTWSEILKKNGNPAGFAQRNRAIEWMREHIEDPTVIDKSGVVFFGQAEHAYDLRLFENVCINMFKDKTKNLVNHCLLNVRLR